MYLDRTAFYPTSGGQPHDLGSIHGIPVIDVTEEDGRIAHVTASPVQAGPVSCVVDWQRRYDHMQQHTGQHLLSAIFVDLFGFATLGFHLGPSLSTIELGVRELSDKDVDRAEAHANQIVSEAHPVTISYDDAQTAEGLRKPSRRSGSLRIITIEGLDRSACGGTHVRSTAELGPIQVRGMERIRGNVRLEFVAGGRALRRAKQDYRIGAALTRMASVAVDELPEFVSALRARTAQAEKDSRRLATELAQFEGTALHAATEPDTDGLRRVLLQVPSIDDSVRARLQAFAKQGRAIGVAQGENPSGVAVVCSPDAGVHAGNVLKAALASAGGSGGGSAHTAQGNMPDATALRMLLTHLGFTD